MNNPNTEWLWNSSANNPLRLPSSNGLSLQRSMATNTDVGICAGMRNVNLNNEPTCFIKNIPHCCKYPVPRPTIQPNWYNHYVQYSRHREDFYTKPHTIPYILSNGLDRLIANDYSSVNISHPFNEWRTNVPSAHVIRRSDDKYLSPDNSDLNLFATKSQPVISIDMVEPSLAPPKKKWIRHYMMGE